jgi:pimeloyl-ACP methyl ester carboxylesterase
MKILISLLLIILSNGFYAQNNLKEQFQIFSFEDSKLGKIEYCTFNSSIKKKKPILLFIHGSGNLPTFHYRKDLKDYAWSGFSEIQRFKDDYHIIFVNKPGIPLFDTINFDKNGNAEYPLNNEYKQKFSLDWRAESASKIINHAIKKIPADKSKIIVIGHSQGGQVVPKVAVINKKVTHIVMLNSNALNHLYDFVLQERLRAFKGETTFEKSQENIDVLFSDYKNIFENPKSREKIWDGETYYRWANFSKETPLENMLKLNIPILMIAGGKDIWGSFIMNTDYAEIEFLQKGKNNLTYKVYPNANHFLQDEIIENGQTLCSQHNFLKKNLNQTETAKKMFIHLYELSKKKGEKTLFEFSKEILKIFEKFGINGHIEWNK